MYIYICIYVYIYIHMYTHTLHLSNMSMCGRGSFNNIQGSFHKIFQKIHGSFLTYRAFYTNIFT